MKPYTIFQQDEKLWLWDKANLQMYEKDKEEESVRVSFNPIALTKFAPYAIVVKETSKLPKGWVHSAVDNQTRQEGIK